MTNVVQTPAPHPPLPLPPPGLDPNFVFGEVAPLIAFVVVMVVGVMALRVLFRSPVGEAWAERIRAGMHRRGHGKWLGGEWGDAPAGGDDRWMAALEEQVSHLQGQISELGERLDFAERLLAERRERKLSAGQ